MPSQCLSVTSVGDLGHSPFYLKQVKKTAQFGEGHFIRRLERENMAETHTVLIVSHDKGHRDLLANSASGQGSDAVCCGTIGAAQGSLIRQHFDAVICEDELPDGNFEDLLQYACVPLGRKVPIIVVSRLDDWDSCLTAMRSGAFDYVAFPPQRGEVERSLDMAFAESRLSERLGAKAAA